MRLCKYLMGSGTQFIILISYFFAFFVRKTNDLENKTEIGFLYYRQLYTKYYIV